MLRARQSQVSRANRLTMPVLRVSKFLIVIWVNNARTCNCYKSPFSLISLKQSVDIKRNWIFPQSQMVISAPNRKYQKHELPKCERWNMGHQSLSQVAASDASSDCCFVPDHTEAFSAQQCLQDQRTTQCLVTVRLNTDFIWCITFPLEQYLILPCCHFAKYKENS